MTGTNHISLFGGVGTTDLAAEQFGIRTVVTAEIDVFNRSVLASRFPEAVHLSDVRHVTAAAIAHRLSRRRPLLVSGGFPCQDISLPGHGAGIEGERSGLWGEFARIIGEFLPEYVLIENVAALRGRGLDRILRDLSQHRYIARWDCIPAAAVGAPHMRDRMFIAAIRADHAEHPMGQFRNPRIAGYVSRSAVEHPTQPGVTLDKLPRAGRLIGQAIYSETTLATQGEARKAVAAGTILLPFPTSYEPSLRKLIPTPSRRDGMSGPGRSPHRKGGPNLRTVVNEQDGDYKLNPLWVEWMMGLPAQWTNPDVANVDLSPFEGWETERLPRTDPNAPHRRQRLAAAGNALVPQAAAIAIDWLHGA